MTYARHLTFSAFSLLLLSGCQNTTAYMTPGEVFTELEVEESAPSQQPAATTTPAPSNSTSQRTTAPVQNFEPEESAPEERRFYRKGEEYEQTQEPEVILPVENTPIAPETPTEEPVEVLEQETYNAAPEVMEESLEPESMEPAAEEQSGSTLSQLLSGTLPWLIGAVALGGGATIMFLRKKKSLPTQIATEQMAPPPPSQEQQASKRLEAAMEAMHAQDPTPATGSETPAA